MGCFSFCKKSKSKSHSKEPQESNLLPATTTAAPSSSNAVIDGEQQASEPPASAPSSQQSTQALHSVRAPNHHNLRVFELKELVDATNGFNRLVKLGEGGFGSVYKGLIKPAGGEGDKITVAVKRLNQDSKQGHKQWLAEVQFLGIVNHPNLVKLIGYCAEDNEKGIQRLLVYEYMPNRSFEDHLFKRTFACLPWRLRLQIALGAAEGLAYLHEGMDVQVIFRDFKTSNVLLDAEFKPRLSDFGLAREGPTDGRSHVSTIKMGTHGYAAPEYLETGHLNAKCDVWSFGVVLYELLTARRALDRSRPREQERLVLWVKKFPVESSGFGMIMDPRLEYQFPLKAARLVALIAERCVAEQPKARPTMREVVEGLEKVLSISDKLEAEQSSAIR